MLGVARVPGTCGELVQGMREGNYFLITCPINIASKVTVTLKSGAVIHGMPGKEKALKAVRMILDKFGRSSLGAKVEINNPLPPGKGLASSTADVVAAAVATAKALGEELSLETIIRITLSIEPSDGNFLPGIALFDHLHGEYWEYLGESPPMNILVVDLGGVVDTVLFNQRQDLFVLNQSKEKDVAKAVQLVKKGLNEEKAELIAQGATLSALANQKILYKPELEDILKMAINCGALGVNTAHSGTVIGILYRDGEVDVVEMKKKIKDKYPYVDFIEAAITGGGIRG
ncbi:MAG: L-threonine kinase [Clostridia bacterium]|nr:L-threonine kinase [Clostridia bacterium]